MSGYSKSCWRWTPNSVFCWVTHAVESNCSHVPLQYSSGFELYVIPHYAMGHGRYKSKNDLCPKNLLIHTDRILAWQGKTEKNVYSQVLVAIQGKHHQCGVDVLVLCVCSQKGPIKVSSPLSHLEQDCGQHWIKLAMASSSRAMTISRLFQGCRTLLAKHFLPLSTLNFSNHSQGPCPELENSSVPLLL